MLMEKEKSCLLVIDLQEKLTPAVFNSKQITERCAWLMQLATELDVPTLICEQYPKGLGSTVSALKNLLPQHPLIEKQSFSAYKNQEFKVEFEKLNRKQAILVGIETHVCVLQTALDLIQAGIQVFTVVDAISARHISDHHTGLERMKQQGVHIVSSEMVFYEWIKYAGTPVFKALNQAFMIKEQSS